MNAQEAQELALKCYADPALFNRTFLPEWYPLPMPWVHRGMLAILSRKVDWLLNFGVEQWPRGEGVWDEKQLDKIIRHFTWSADPDDPKAPRIPLFTLERDSKGHPARISMKCSDKMLFIMPRGISKTTNINADNIRSACYKDTDFIVYLSETGPHSATQLDTVKRQFESNELIIEVFGTKKPERTDAEHWASHQIETTDGVVVVAKGRGGQIRGLNINSKRPQRIIFDDVEDKESVKTDEQRKKTKDWFEGDVVPALPMIAGTRSGQLIGAATILDNDSLAVSLSKDPEWVTVQFGAIDPDGDMLWEHYLTRDQYERKKRSYRRKGLLSTFRKEFDSTARPEPGTAKFDQSYIYYQPRLVTDTVARAIVVDPAISDKKDSDFCAYAVVGITEKGFIHVYDVYMEVGMSPRRQVDKYFELHTTWDCTRHGCEAVAYQKALVHLLKEEMFRRGKTLGPKAYFHVDEIIHGNTGKVQRVEGILSTRYAAGYVTHQRRFTQYEEQLLDWPNGKKDGPDVVAMAVALLDPFAQFAFDPDNEAEDRLAADQYPPLDEVMGSEGRREDWRLAP